MKQHSTRQHSMKQHSTRQRTRGRTVPTDLAALAAGVPAATIRKWASRGKLTRYGRPGRAEYSLDELREIMRAQSDRIAS